jgi:hypothetical protein
VAIKPREPSVSHPDPDAPLRGVEKGPTNPPRTSRPEVFTGRDLIEALEQLVRERYPEGLVRTLEDRYGRHGTAADDAVGDALETMVRKADRLQVRDPRTYLTTVASHAMAKARARAARRGEVELTDGEGDVLFRSEEDGKRLFAIAKGIINGWENKNMRVARARSCPRRPPRPHRGQPGRPARARRAPASRAA